MSNLVSLKYFFHKFSEQIRSIMPPPIITILVINT